MKIFATAAIASLIALGAGAPAAAQDEAGDKVSMVIAYGDDEVDCPEDTICVVARMDESERFRIPENLRYSNDPANTAWAKRVESFEYVGKFGAMSCSPSGAAGFTGCTQKMIDAAFARFSQLIAEARAERLSTIDEDAAAEQERVEQIEREYMERIEREREAEVAAEALPQPTAKQPDGSGDE